MAFEHLGTLRSGTVALDQGIDFLAVAGQDGGAVLYSASDADGGIVAWSLTGSGQARELDRVLFPGSLATGTEGVVALDPGTGDGPAQLLLGGTSGSRTMAYTLDAEGGIGALSPAATVPAGAWVGDAVAMGGTVYSADLASGRIVTAEGSLTGVAIEGMARLATARVGTTDVLLIADPGRQGVSSYTQTSGGGLRHRDTAGAEEGLGIATPTALEVVTAHGKTFVLIGGAESGSISVLELAADGRLTPRDHVIDTRETRFGAVQSLATATADGQVYVAAGGGDDGISLFLLRPDGRFVHLDTLAHDTGLGLAGVTALALVPLADGLHLFVAAEDSTGLSHLRHETVGSTTRGGAGADVLVAAAGATLTGGAGADIFVPGYGTARTRIADFNPAEDRLDLSDFPMLRGPDQIAVTRTATGAELRYRDAVITLTSHTRQGLEASDIFGPAFSWPDRILILADPSLGGSTPGGGDGALSPGGGGSQGTGGNGSGSGSGSASGGGSGGSTGGSGSAGGGTSGGGSPGGGSTGGWGDTGGGGTGGGITTPPDTLNASGGRGAVLNGTARPDELAGWGRDDTISGLAGNDTLMGGAGWDSISGGVGRDTLWGGTGHDTLDGGDGHDLLGGATGNDRLRGAGGNDGLWGGPGNDTLDGGAGNDSLGSFTGDDSLTGGDGQDELWGAEGNDTLSGDAGNDLLGGGTGNDALDGGGNDDLIFGGLGADTASGGDGNDRLYGAAGDDVLHGDAGDDLLWGGPGNDHLSGGAGADVFYFSPGQDRITDFAPDADRLHIYDAGLRFGTLDLRQVGQAVELHVGGSVMTLANTSLEALSSDNFSFG